VRSICFISAKAVAVQRASSASSSSADLTLRVPDSRNILNQQRSHLHLSLVNFIHLFSAPQSAMPFNLNLMRILNRTAFMRAYTRAHTGARGTRRMCAVRTRFIALTANLDTSKPELAVRDPNRSAARRGSDPRLSLSLSLSLSPFLSLSFSVFLSLSLSVSLSLSPLLSLPLSFSLFRTEAFAGAGKRTVAAEATASYVTALSLSAEPLRTAVARNPWVSDSNPPPARSSRSADRR